MGTDAASTGPDDRGGSSTVTTIGADRLDEFVGPWRDLLARALEPNVLHGPDVLGPSLAAFAGDTRLLVASRGHGRESRMVGLLPLWRPRLGFGLFGRLPTVFSNEFTPLGTPLIDADRPEEALDALLTAATHLAPGLVFTHLGLTGPVAHALRATVAARGDRFFVATSHERAALLVAARAEGSDFTSGIRPKRWRDWQRQWRRLGEIGPLETTSVRGPAARAAFADFLALEAAGWKGRRGSALAQSPAERRFGESIVDALADHDGVVVDRIDLDGRALAMLVSFGAGGHYVTWKTAYDEAFAAFSPGTQIMLRASTRFLGEPDVAAVDSLAVADHPLFEHMWRDVRTIGTVVVGFTGRSLRPRMLTGEIRLRDRLRGHARRLRDRWFDPGSVRAP